MKPFKPLLLFIISAISAFTLQTCKPDDEYGKTYGPYTLGEAKSYLNFKEGSWWVYQNSKSGLYDTLVLTNINIRMKTFTGKNTIIKEMIDMVIYSTTTKFEYKYYSSGANPDAIPEYLKGVNFITLWLGKSKSGEYHGETVSFFYPFDTTKVTGNPGEATYERIDSTFIIKGKTYYNVRKFQQVYDACFANKIGVYFWAKDVGLIKKGVENTNDYWEIVNYNIIKP